MKFFKIVFGLYLSAFAALFVALIVIKTMFWILTL